MAACCAATVLFLAARDLFVPHVRDTEVWLGFELHGLAARLTAPLHWALYTAGAVAFWRDRPWIWNAAAAYAGAIAVSHLVWNLTSASGGGLGAGLWQAALFSLPAIGLYAAPRWRR
jgi:hypothetical protein